MSTTADIDTALRVVVSPSQSSYFAGEPLQVTITITNTRSASEPANLPSLSAARHAHKRSAHSVSSAPLARPPTSPGLLRSTSSLAVPSSSKLVNGTGPKNIIQRKGLVGLRVAQEGADQLPLEIKEGRKRMLAKSLSVDILPSQLADQLKPDDAKGKSPQRLAVPSSPRISSPLARTPSTASDLPVPAHHPHSRKPSLLEIPSQPTAAPFVNQPAHPFNATSSQLPPVPQTASASASSFSVSLDPIAETLTSPIPQTPGIPSPITPSHSFAPTSVPAPLINGRSRSKSGEALTNGHAYPPRGPPTTTAPNDNTNTRKPAQHALGHGLPSSSSLTDLGSSSTPHKPLPPKRQSTLPTLGPLPNSELVLYAYVQLTGLATLAPTASASNTRSVPLGALRDKYTKARGMVCGGGSMDITGSVTGMGGGMGTPMMGSGGGSAGLGGMGAARKRHARSTSLTAGLLSLLSPALGGGGGGGPGSIPSHSSVPSGVGSTGVGGAPVGGSGWTPGHRNRTSYIGSLFSPSVSSFSIPPTPKTATGALPQSQSQSQNPGGKGVGLGLGVDGNVPNGNGHVGVANGYGPGHRNGHVNGGSAVVRERQREYIPPPPQGMLVDEWDPETALPVFEVRPAMLAVDLSLGPGESRSYTYTVALPSHLPPTFKGRSLKFSYELAVGTCRASTSSKPPSNASNSSLGGSPSVGGSTSTSSSRVMKVPIRVYNHVSVDRPQRPYDLLGLPSSSPEIPAEAKVAEIEVPLTVPVQTHKQALFGVGAGNGDGDGEYRNQISSPVSPSLTPLPPLKGSIGDLRMYGLRLLHDAEQDRLLSPSITSPNGIEATSSLSPSSSSSLSPPSALSPPTSALSPISEPDDAPTGTLRGCREAVEILTRVPKKVSYDVHKDGVKVAVLTFTKQAWRLGETVVGVVEVNERSGRGRVLKLSAMLEAHESLPADLSAPSDARYLKRVHAEHHTSFVASTSRTTFSLDIPSDASPAFQVSLDPSSSSSTPPTYTYGQPFNGSSNGNSGQLIGGGSKKGGLEWKVRLCLLVAVAKPNTWAGKEGVRTKGLVRQGAKGEWGSSWVPTGGIGGLERVLETPATPSSPHANPPGLNGKGVGAVDGSGSGNEGEKGKTKSWGEFFANAFLGPTENAFHDGDLDSYSSEEEGEEDDSSSISSSDSPGRRDRAGHGGTRVGAGKGRGGKGKGGKGEEDLGGGKDGWTELGVEMVECEVPVKVWPGNTAFRAMDVLFDV